MLVAAEEVGRGEAIDVLQLTMLRMLTAMPPGKVRFTILDPVGLGEAQQVEQGVRAGIAGFQVLDHAGKQIFAPA